MVNTKMVGITELMTDNKFVAWVEKQADALLSRLSTFELYQLYSATKKVRQLSNTKDGIRGNCV